MKRWGWWLGLLVLTALVSIGGWNWVRGVSEPVPQGEMERSAIVLAVDGDRLLSHVQALAFERVSEPARAQARTYLTTALQAAGWNPQAQGFEGGINLVAERPGTDPAAGTVILAAHYDTVERSPGADDNATGLATVLEAARLFGSLATPRTLKLVLFDREEVGLLGSTAYVAQVAEPEKTRAVVLDMIGYRCTQPGCQHYPTLPITPPSDTGTFLAVVGDQAHGAMVSAFQNLSDSSLPPVFTLTIPLLGPLRPDLVRSDHAAFWASGMGAVLVTDTANFRNPHYHQPTDTPETLDPVFFRGAASIVLQGVLALLDPSKG